MLKLNFSEKIEVGTDEAGRGCLAGPVTAGAVILPKDFKNAMLNDSKQLNQKKRLFLKEVIEASAIAYQVAHVYPEEIDAVNILNASILGMHNAIKNLAVAPEFILVDGNYFKTYAQIPHQCIVKGDSTYMNIAAASILAKTYRDAYMIKIHEEYPMYNWKQNKGYPTQEHRKAIEKYGITEYHRKSFKLFPESVLFEL